MAGHGVLVVRVKQQLSAEAAGKAHHVAGLDALPAQYDHRALVQGALDGAERRRVQIAGQVRTVNLGAERRIGYSYRKCHGCSSISLGWAPVTPSRPASPESRRRPACAAAAR